MSEGLKSALLFQPTETIGSLHSAAMQYEALYVGPSSVHSDFRDLRVPNRRISKVLYDDQNNQHSLEARVSQSEELEDELVEAFVGPRVPITCWNCKESGHSFADCIAARTIFCYGCGAENVYRPNCSRCKTGNGNRGVATVSTTRPTQTMTQARAANPFARR